MYPARVGGADMALSAADLNTLGIDTSKPPRVEPSPEEVTATRGVPSWQRLLPGSVLAKALYETVSGRRVTVIDSPPGSGKTTLLVHAALRSEEHTSELQSR